MWCLDAKTGQQVYGRQRLRSATYSGSPVLADGKIYITDEDGVTSVVQAGPKFALLAENDLGEYTLSSPAISDGQIFIRTDSFLYAIGQREQQVIELATRRSAHGGSHCSCRVFLCVRRVLGRGGSRRARPSARRQTPAVSMVADEGEARAVLAALARSVGPGARQRQRLSG